MREITTRDRLRYRFDTIMSLGAPAMLGGLTLVTLVLVAVAGFVLTVFEMTTAGGQPPGFLENCWISLMRALDTGQVATDRGWGFRIFTLIITVGGLFIVSALISILTAALDTRLTQMRKGRSFVVEKNHVLILGWTSKIFTVISELIIANGNHMDAVVVILAERDKVLMDDDLKTYLPRTKTTRIVTRSGSPTDMNDLDMANPYDSKAIIILAPDGPTADAETVKTILALTNNPKRRKLPYHIVAEMKEGQNLQVARLVGKDEVELIAVDELIARIAVQSCRQSGLSVVYNDLMDFEGGEIYFSDFPNLVGKSYGEALFSFPNSAVLGIFFKSGKVTLNPPADTVLHKGDQIVALSDDDSTMKCGVVQRPRHEFVTQALARSSQPERTLILGWNRKGSIILKELNRYVPSGSMVTVISTFPVSEILDPLARKFKNFELSYFEENTSDRAVLEQLHVNEFDHILLLAYQEKLDLQQADAQTLITLLHLRDIWEKAGKPLRIVTEMLDLRNRELANVTKADDFIVSDKLMSLLMAQIAENKHLMRVFDDLFQHEGSEIYIKPASEYTIPGSTLDFYAVLEAAKARGETAIGYRLMDQQYSHENDYGLVLNPVKTETFTLKAKDCVIVLAES